MILIVGAGLAGLTCAKVLAAEGKQVRVLEAADAVGGRVRTDANAEGFLLDRGFQVLFTSYPAAQRHLDLSALRPRPFMPGAVIIRGGQWHEVGDPLSQPTLLVPTLRDRLLPLSDKLRTMRLRRYARSLTLDTIFTGKPRGLRHGDQSTLAELRRRHFAEQGFIDAFARPFFGGIFLDRSLETSARMLLFTFKMLASGKIVIPEGGMGQITAQLAAGLPTGAIHLQTRVEGLIEAEDRAVGVSLTGGEEVQGDAVVIATDAPTAARLSGRTLPDTPVGATCVYFASTTSLYSGPKLLLNADPNAFVNNAVQISNVSRAYAPRGQHLLSATVLGTPEMDDDALIQRCREEMAPWFPGKDLKGLRHLGTYRIPFAQFAQSPGIFATLPPVETATAGLFLAGEYTESSSIHGAMMSGEHAAQAVLRYLSEE